eukprot:CAMPEP_0115704368 /NCGR_PEP_ID=MMETSP0272-20121206/69619_1 /TAXON_ID=71861 /ORGANISM="Scrippsiella trochoidea, Strain CCMP3099" /LENGTH=163 /DNA_ID=CAMNT_0003145343 /DNA_START=171 /DNA_END=664 /DNA_ORIENTATION=-
MPFRTDAVPPSALQGFPWPAEGTLAATLTIGAHLQAPGPHHRRPSATSSDPLSMMASESVLERHEDPGLVDAAENDTAGARPHDDRIQTEEIHQGLHPTARRQVVRRRTPRLDLERQHVEATARGDTAGLAAGVATASAAAAAAAVRWVEHDCEPCVGEFSED